MESKLDKINALMTPEFAEQMGIWQYGIVTTDQIPFYEEVRKMCEVNTCRKYGTTWACPPGVGTLEECEAKCHSYKYMLLMSGKYDLEDSFDIESMEEGARTFRKVADALKPILDVQVGDYFQFSTEGCENCASCTYPDAPCRFPDKMIPSIEGYGIMVSELAKKAGINYINGANTVTYFGAVLFN